MNLGHLRVTLLIALRSLVAHRVKSLIVGAIMLFGTFLLVLGTAMLDSVQTSMQRSITSSLTGQVQVYDAHAKDELSMFGGFGMANQDVGEIPDFDKVRTSLLAVPNVKAVVPMGITLATVFGRNEIDTVLDSLRDALAKGDVDREHELEVQVQQISATIGKDYALRAEVVSDRDKVKDDLANLDRATSADFWSSFDQDPQGHLQFLDTHIAPLAADGRMLFVRALGTDLEEYQKSFDTFEIKDGTMVPSGHRGMLFSKAFYEKQIKHLVARNLDAIKLARDQDKQLIATTETLQEQVKRNAGEYQRITFELDPKDATALQTELATYLKQPPGTDLGQMLQTFLTVDDSNFDERYKWFYDHIGPRIQLYAIKVGDVMTLRAYTKSGFMKSVNVRVYGTFAYQGLEQSDLAQAANLCDLVTFRELYGKMSADQQAELAGIKQQVGAKEVTRDDAESSLFGGGGDLVADSAPHDMPAGLDDITVQNKAQRQEDLDAKVYSKSEMDNGLALNAAVILKDPTRISAAMRDISAKSDADGLGLKVVDWQAAAGIVGQFLIVVRLVLYVAIFITFLVALVIINNSMVMATMERTAEIGTMRAIGAQRSFVMWLFLLETVALGAIAGGAGALLASAFILFLGHIGVPAVSSILVLLFAGPRLYPTVSAENIGFGMGLIFLVSLLSTLYPALLAARVAPVVAMAGKGD